MSDLVGPELGLSDETKAALPAVPAGWTAYPSLGGGVGAKKWFDQLQAYKDVVVSNPDDLAAAVAAVDAEQAPDAPLPVDAFQEAVEAPVTDSGEEIAPPAVDTAVEAPTPTEGEDAPVVS